MTAPLPQLVIERTETSDLLRVFQLAWSQRLRFAVAMVASMVNGAVTGYLLVMVQTLWDRWSAVQAAHDKLVPEEQKGQIISAAVAAMQHAGVQALIMVPVAAVTAFVAWYAGQYLANELMRMLRARFVGHLVSQELAFHDQLSRGEMLARMTNDLDRMRATMRLLFGRVIIRPIEVLGLLAFLFYINWQMAIVLVIVLIPMGIAVTRLVARTHRRSQQVRHSQEKVFTDFEQITAGIRVVKSMGSTEREIERYAQANDRFATDNRRLARTRAWSEAVTEGGIYLFIAVAMLAGAWLFQRELLAPSALILMLAGAARMMTSLREMQRAVAEMIESLPSIRRVFAILDRQPVLTDHPNVRPAAAPTQAIVFHDVHFTYATGSAEVLRGVNLTIPMGSTVALVGKSGGGKSTLIDLIPRLRDVTAGQITWDGVDVRELRQADLVSHVAIVSQDAFLFDDTIRANIRYGRPAASDSEIEAAARRAHIHDAILSLEGGLGYDTVVGDRGGRLSGGQRQRVAIARALLRDAPILLMDEPTSALDAESEHHVQLALAELMRGRTVVVIAHRLATVQHADRIYVLAGKDDVAMPGTIIECGTHTELVARGGAYAQLAARQRLDG